MATRRERVILDLQDDFSGPMMKCAGATAVLNRELGALDGRGNLADTAMRNLSRDLDGVTRSTQRADQSINQLTGRLRLIAQLAAMLGPGLVPIGGTAVVGVTGLANAFGAAAIAGGSLLTAMVGVGDAVEAVNDAALEPTAENLEKAREAMALLGPDARKFVREFQEFRPTLTMIRDAAAAGWFPGLTEALGDLERVAPRIADIMEAVGAAGGDAIAGGAESFASARWRPFLDFLEVEMPAAVTSLSAIVGDLARGLAEMWMAFQPGNNDFLGWLENVADGFDRWAQSAEGRESMADFLDYVRQTGPQVRDLFVALVDVFTEVSKAAAPLGGPVLQALTSVAEVVANIAESDLGTPFLIGAAALSTYNRAMAVSVSLQKSAAAGGLFAGPIVGRANDLKSSIPTVREFGTVMANAGKGAGNASKELLKARESVRGFARAAGAAGAPVAGLGLAASGVAENTGLANTASLGLIGTLGGPLGAALGATIGLALDAAAANNDLEDSFESLSRSITRGQLVGSDTMLGDLADQVAEFKRSVGDGASGWDDLLAGFNPATWKNKIEGLFGMSDVDEQEANLAAARAQVELMSEAVAGLGRAMGENVGPIDGSSRSLAELQGILEKAGPAMAGAGVSAGELAAALAIDNAWWSGGSDIFGGLVGQIDDFNSSAETAIGFANRLADAMGFLDKRASFFAYQESLKQVNSALEENGRTLARNTEAGIANNRVLDSIAQSGLRYAETLKGMPRKEFLNDLRESLRATFLRFNDNEKAARRYLEELGLLDRQKPKPEVDMETGGFDRKKRKVDGDVRDIDRKKAKPKADLDTGRFDNEAARVRDEVNRLDGMSASIRVNVQRVASGIVDFLDGKPSADGGTVPKTGLPYADRHPYLLADGEEVISNRHGQADRHRGLLKAINAGRLADGGTAGPVTRGWSDGAFSLAASDIERAVMRGVQRASASSSGFSSFAASSRAELATWSLERLAKTSDEASKAVLREMERRLDAAEKVHEANRAAFDAITEARKQFEQELRQSVTSDLFGQRGGGSSTFVFQAPQGFESWSPEQQREAREEQRQVWLASVQGRSPLDTLRGDIENIGARSSLLAQLRGMGLKGAGFREYATAASLAELSQLAAGGRGQVREFADLYQERGRMANQYGRAFGGAEYGADQAAARADRRESLKELRQVRRALEKHKARLERIEDAVDKGSGDVVAAVRGKAARDRQSERRGGQRRRPGA